jgi:hypothetical protein
MFRKIALFALIGILAVAAYGSAAALNVSGGTIQAGSDTDLTCTAAVEVLGWGLEIDSNLVNSVRLGIPSTCEGNALFVKINANPEVEINPIPTIPQEGLRVGFSAMPAEAVTSVSIWIEGPNP